MNRILPLILLLGLAAGCAGVKPHGDGYEFSYELRAPETLKLEPMTSFDLVTDHGESATRLLSAQKRNEEGYAVFASSIRLSEDDTRRAIIVSAAAQPSQVFRLALPGVLAPVGWTAWQRPDYTEKSNASWTFMNGLSSPEQSTNLPPDCFEIRYKVTEFRYQIEADEPARPKAGAH